MTYRHQWIDQNKQANKHPQPPSLVEIDLPVGKIACVGRNYREHAVELGNPVPKSPLLFLKPNTSLQAIEKAIQLPAEKGECHFECEIALLVGETLSSASSDKVLEGIIGVGLGLDLTLRTLQSELKQKGHPWELAKAFDGACPMTPFLKLNNETKSNLLDHIGLSISIDGYTRQQGSASEMIFPITDLIVFISQHFTLLPGDIVMTGTPAGVGALKKGQLLEMSLFNKGSVICSYPKFVVE